MCHVQFQCIQESCSITSVEDLTAALSSPKAHRLQLRSAPLRTQRKPGPESTGAFLVWRAATAGCSIHGGTVELPGRGVLLLAGSGAHFHGTTFKGLPSLSPSVTHHLGSWQRGVCLFVYSRACCRLS